MITQRVVLRWVCVAALFLATLGCRPVLAVGWQEILIIVVAAIILIGPLAFRLYRFIERAKRKSDRDNSK